MYMYHYMYLYSSKPSQILYAINCNYVKPFLFAGIYFNSTFTVCLSCSGLCVIVYMYSNNVHNVLFNGELVIMWHAMVNGRHTLLLCRCYSLQSYTVCVTM